MSIPLRKNIAIAFALLFHFCGAVGILFTQYKDWFIANTPLNLMLMAVLLIFTQPQLNKQFFLFALLCIAVGFIVELIGVNTHVLFGEYSYGNVMGVKLWGVPVLIGLQWFVTVFCCGAIMQGVNNWANKKLVEYGEEDITTKKVQSVSLIIDAALLAVFFDYIMEPMAQKLGYWQWKNNEVPYFNYTCWFFISGFLLFLFNKFSFNKLNPFALHLFIIQLIFFIALRLYL